MLEHIRSERLGRKGWVPPGEIGQANNFDPICLLAGLFDEGFGLRHIVIAAKNQLCRANEFALLQCGC